jgi:hypothetical protein
VRATLIAILLGACATTHVDGDAGADALVPMPDAHVVDAWSAADLGTDAGPAPARDLTGDWSGTRTDISITPASTTAIAFHLVQSGGALIVSNGTTTIGMGTIASSSADFYAGSPPPGDASTNTYMGTVSAACDRIDGEWWAFEMSHGPLVLHRP